MQQLQVHVSNGKSVNEALKPAIIINYFRKPNFLFAKEREFSKIYHFTENKINNKIKSRRQDTMPLRQARKKSIEKEGNIAEDNLNPSDRSEEKDKSEETEIDKG